jgi:hypothetical protein
MKGGYQAGTGKCHGPTSRVRKDAVDLLLEYGKIPWTYFESTERYHGPTSRLRKDSMDLL